MKEFSAVLSSGLDSLDLSGSQEAVPKLLDYLALMIKWNKTYNLTAIREPEKMLTHHLLDSLAVIPYLYGKTIADIGSGAGLPGIPIALLKPDLQVALVEANQKKATFLRQACIQLKIANATVHCERVESWQPPMKYQMVISRAFSDLALFVRVAAHLCESGGVMLAMKGVYPHEEIRALTTDVNVERIIPLSVPELEAERHLVVMRVN